MFSKNFIMIRMQINKIEVAGLYWAPGALSVQCVEYCEYHWAPEHCRCSV